MPTIKVNGVDLYFEEYGEGTPLLLVAGLGGTGSYWNPQIRTFSENFRVITHDHRGTGKSTHDTTITYSVKQMSDDLLGLMDALEIEKAHLLGHSTGGAIGQVLSIDHPDRLLSAVLYASWVKSDPFIRNVFDVRKTLLRESGGAAYAEATPIFLYPDWWINENQVSLDELEKNTVANFPPVQVAISRCDAVVNFNREADLGRINVPTLVVCARDDFLMPVYCSEELAKNIPDAELVFVERGGHACSQTAIEEFNSLTLSWLKKQDLKSR